MEQRESSTPSCKGKYLNRNERILMEGFLEAGKGCSWIAAALERDRGTIRLEIERGMAEHIHTDLSVSTPISKSSPIASRRKEKRPSFD